MLITWGELRQKSGERADFALFGRCLSADPTDMQCDGDLRRIAFFKVALSSREAPTAFVRTGSVMLPIWLNLPRMSRLTA